MSGNVCKISPYIIIGAVVAVIVW